MNWRQVQIIYRKELLDAIRDKRTLIATVFIPLLLFPILTVGFGALAAKSMRKMQQEGATLMLLGTNHAPEAAALFSRTPGITILPSDPQFTNAINEKKIRAAVEFPPAFQEQVEQGATNLPPVAIYHHAGEMRSQVGVRNVQRVLAEYTSLVVNRRLESNGLSTAILKPFAVREMNVAAPAQVAGNILGGLIPYLIIFLCFMGAVHPATDLTAGEKERGTIETILASPVSRLDLAIGKFLMVLTASMVTTILSLLSFALTFALPFLAMREMGRSGASPFHFELSLLSMLSVFLLVLPLAIMFSAGLLALALYAKTFREAQSYISPLMIVVIMPAVAAMLPGFEPNLPLAFVPILNVSLISKDILSGQYHWGLITIVFGSSCLYAAIALKLASSAFKQEWVLFRT